jgi:hypothetical protein
VTATAADFAGELALAPPGLRFASPAEAADDVEVVGDDDDDPDDAAVLFFSVVCKPRGERFEELALECIDAKDVGIPMVLTSTGLFNILQKHRSERRKKEKKSREEQE